MLCAVLNAVPAIELPKVFESGQVRGPFQRLLGPKATRETANSWTHRPDLLLFTSDNYFVLCNPNRSSQNRWCAWVNLSCLFLKASYGFSLNQRLTVLPPELVI